MEFKEYKNDIINIKISNTCFLTDPPIYTVSINNGEWMSMNGIKICDLLKVNNFSDEYFNQFDITIESIYNKYHWKIKKSK